MEAARFDQIRHSFGRHASWAYWAMPRADRMPRAEVANLSIFDPTNNPELLSTVHSNFVLFGLNVSRAPGSDHASWRNFHDEGPKGRDYRLRYAIHGTPLWGSYLTDFFVDVEQYFGKEDLPKSKKVMRWARERPDQVSKQVDERKSELTAIGADSATLVALGISAHGLLKKHFGGRRIIKIPHYAAYYKLPEYRSMVLSVLQTEGI